MPTWKEVISSEEYQGVPPSQKVFTKFRFWKNTISKSPKFTSLSGEDRTRIRKNFFTERPEEGISIKDFTREGLREPIFTNVVLPAFKKGDELAEKLATAIEGEVSPTKSLPSAILTEFPRFLVGETIRMYKPSRVALAFGISKAIKPIAKPVGKFVGKAIPEPVKRFFTKEFTIGAGAPKPYVAAKEAGQLAKAAGAREAQEVAKVLTTGEKGRILTIPEQRYIGRIFRKEVIASPTLQAHPKFQELKSISNAGRKIMDKWSSELAKSGIPSAQAKETIESNVGRYMARMYRTKLKNTGRGFSLKGLRLRLNGLKHRKDLSERVLKELGEIKEPALPAAIRVREISSSLADNKLFNTVAKNPEWVANTNLTGNMMQMAKTKSLGALAGKFVVPEIARDINAVMLARTQSQSIYMKALSAWKYGKVVLNPATHVRNMISNSMLLDLSGTNHIRQTQLMPRAIKEYLNKGKIYQSALEHGAIGGEFVGGEVGIINKFYAGRQGGNLLRWMNVAKIPFQKMGKIYQGEEQLAKLVKFMDVLSKGAPPKVAAREAQKWLFDYTKIPNAVKLAKHVAPFVTFTYKAIPRVGEAIVNNPMRVYKYYALFNAWNQASRKTLGMLPEEFAREKKALPPWLLRSIGGVPANLLMPWKDKHKRTQWLNLEYILPLGMAPEILQRGVIKGFVSNPFFNIVADLQKNQDFKGKPIIPTGATRAEASRITVDYIYRQLAPSLAPGLKGTKGWGGGYSFAKIMNSIQKIPDYADRIRTVPSALLDSLAGLKLTPLDVRESEKFKMFDKQRMIMDLRGQLMKLNHPAISEKERVKQAEQIHIKIQRVMEQ
jgi:hypothetical protein